MIMFSNDKNTMRFAVVLSVFVIALGATIPAAKTSIEEYIVGGRPTNIEEVPYQIALLLAGQFLCGGSIITPTHILTAAHCVLDNDYSIPNSSYSIRAGSSNKTNGGLVIPSKTIAYHPKFSYKTFDYDIAVIELQTPLKFNKSIKIIKIADAEPGDTETVKVSGWGCLKENGTRPTQLHSVVVPMVNRKVCEKNYKDFMPITQRMICAGVEGKDSCQGDSGGPLVHKDKLIGVVSFGNGCARKDCPGVYANLANPDMRKFIKEHAKI